MSIQLYHLAELNIAQMRAPLTDPIMREFVDNLIPINRLAEQSPGFLWRLQTEEGDATSLRIFDNDRMIINLSLWDSTEALRTYVYKSQHREFLQRKKAWFDKLESVHFVMWWIPAGQIPTITQAKAKLEHLAAHGDSAEAFTFRKVFAAVQSVGTEPWHKFQAES